MSSLSGRINNGRGYRIVIDNRVLDEMLRGPNGVVVRDLIRRADRLQAAAKKQCGYGEGNDQHGHLRDSIVKRVLANGAGDPQVRVGSTHPIALMHHNGTRPHVITPTNALVLAFPSDWAAGGIQFSAYVDHPGTAPNRYLTDNLPAVAHESGNYK